MIFTALKERLKTKYKIIDPLQLVQAQLDLGLDTMVELRTFSSENERIGHADAPGIPLRFADAVTVHEWVEIPEGESNALMFKKYSTPAGDLSVIINHTRDWPYGNPARGKFSVPLMDDYLAPRSKKYLIEEGDQIEALKYLLRPPEPGDVKKCREEWSRGKKFAENNHLLLSGGWGVGGDALAWFCGLQNAVVMALERPDELKAILQLIHAWSIKRMEIFLDFGVDLFIRRAWYEGTDFWSPDLFLEFLAPAIRDEVRMTHEAGSKYGLIMTSGATLLYDILIDLEIDVLIGIDPVQGRMTNLKETKKKISPHICTWGGVNGFITVERGSGTEIHTAVKEAVEMLGPDGYILSPVDNIRDPSDQVWENVLNFIGAWKKYCLKT